MTGRILRSHVIAGLLYLVVAIYLTAPIYATLSTRFLGGDTSDAYEMAHHVWWYKTALLSGEDVFYQSLLAYPDGFAAVVLWANPLQYFPMWLLAIALPLATAYNLGILLTLTLNGWAMYAFSRRRFSREYQVPALIAGLVYMIFPVFQGHLFDAHAGLLAQWPAPLLLLCLFEYVDGGRRRWLIASLVFFLLTSMGHTLQFVFMLLPLMALFLIARLYRGDYVGATRLVVVVAVGSLLLLLFLSPILAQTLGTAQYTEAGGYVRYSIDLLGAVSPSFENPFWRDVAPHSKLVLGTNLGEGASYFGVFGVILAVIGILFRKETRWWLLVAAVSWLLALGPVLKVFDQAFVVSIAGYSAVIPLPYVLFMNLPLVELARAPGRFMFLFALAFSVVAGYGMLVLWTSPLFQQRSRLIRFVLIFALALLIFRDYQFFEEFPSLPAGIPERIRDLKDRTDIRAIYNVPYDHLLAAKEAMYLQTAHGKPLIAGQDTRVTPVDTSRLALLSSFEPSLLEEAGADVVIVNKVRAAEIGQYDLLYWTARERLGRPFYEDGRYALFDSRPQRTVISQDPVYSTLGVDGSHITYIHKSQPGWLEFSATLTAVNRRVQLSLNDVRLQSVEVTGPTELSLPLPLARRGYHSFQVALDPPCPDRFDTTVLLCHDVTMDEVNIAALTTGAIYDPIRIADGIELSGYYMPEDYSDELEVHFWWSFDTSRSESDVRFIHILDQNRRLMDQADDSFGVVQAGSDRFETVRLDIGNFAPGEYRVLTGWYALPDSIRYDVLTNVDGAQDNTIVLGVIAVGE